MEFESHSLREADEFLRDVPLEADECCDKCKAVVSLLLMPGNAQGFNTAKHFSTVIIIAEVALDKGACRSWDAENLQIILVFRDRKDTLSLPDVNNGITIMPALLVFAGPVHWTGKKD